jgi:hypothetical protein
MQAIHVGQLCQQRLDVQGRRLAAAPPVHLLQHLHGGNSPRWRQQKAVGRMPPPAPARHDSKRCVRKPAR